MLFNALKYAGACYLVYLAWQTLRDRSSLEVGREQAMGFGATHTAPSGATTRWTWTGDDVRVRTDPSGNIVSFSYPETGVDRENPRMRPVAEVRGINLFVCDF